MFDKQKSKIRKVSLETNEPIQFENMKISSTDYDFVKREMYRDNYRVKKALKKYGIEAKRIH